MKCILYLVFLIILSDCKGIDNAIFFEVNRFTGNGGEYNVKVGDIFALKLNTVANSWVLLNKNEIKSSVTFLKTDISEPQPKDSLGNERGGYLYYYFKANSKTTEPVLLKFTDAYSYLKQAEPIPKEVFKINVDEK